MIEPADERLIRGNRIGQRLERADLGRLRHHAATSADLAAAAGCGPRTVELIRNQDEPRDAEFGELLRIADEAN